MNQFFVKTSKGIVDFTLISFIREDEGEITVFLRGEETETLSLVGEEAKAFMELVSIPIDLTKP